jgi:hypothetical protein
VSEISSPHKAQQTFQDEIDLRQEVTVNRGLNKIPSLELHDFFDILG